MSDPNESNLLIPFRSGDLQKEKANHPTVKDPYTMNMLVAEAQ